jgi:hypothetical protein
MESIYKSNQDEAENLALFSDRKSLTWEVRVL